MSRRIFRWHPKGTFLTSNLELYHHIKSSNILYVYEYWNESFVHLFVHTSEQHFQNSVLFFCARVSVFLSHLISHTTLLVCSTNEYSNCSEAEAYELRVNGVSAFIKCTLRQNQTKCWLFLIKKGEKDNREFVWVFSFAYGGCFLYFTYFFFIRSHSMKRFIVTSWDCLLLWIWRYIMIIKISNSKSEM